MLSLTILTVTRVGQWQESNLQNVEWQMQNAENQMHCLYLCGSFCSKGQHYIVQYLALSNKISLKANSKQT